MFVDKGKLITCQLHGHVVRASYAESAMEERSKRRVIGSAVEEGGVPSQGAWAVQWGARRSLRPGCIQQRFLGVDSVPTGQLNKAAQLVLAEHTCAPKPYLNNTEGTACRFALCSVCSV